MAESARDRLSGPSEYIDSVVVVITDSALSECECDRERDVDELVLLSSESLSLGPEGGGVIDKGMASRPGGFRELLDRMERTGVGE